MQTERVWSSVALPAVVATVVSVIVTTSLGRLGRHCSALWAARRRDHSTIDAGYFSSDNGSRPCFLCVVRCAPARRLRRPVALPHHAASLFVTTVIPTLPATPASFTPEGVRFERVPNEFGLVESAWLGATGIVEVARPLTVHVGPDGAQSLAPHEVAEYIRDVVSAVKEGMYSKLYGTSRRLDWSVTLSAMHHNEQGITSGWDALLFVGTAPAGRATQGQPAQPRPHFGSSELRSRRQDCPTEHIVAAVLTDWLGRSGYWDYSAAVQEIVEQVH